VYSDGTILSLSVKSWLAVPRMPMTDQVSMIVAAWAGTHITRVAGVPAGVMRGFVSSSISTQGHTSHAA
jgi:hypothetical protein